MERRSMSRTLVAGVFGGGYGLVISLLVNIALVAIAKNKIFATYFGILFSLLGSGFLWRICKSPVTVTGGSSIHRPLLITFAILVLIAGVFCFVVEGNILHLSTGLRIPIFILLGITVCFALTFISLDLINVCIGLVCRGPSPQRNRGIVETPAQVYTLLTASIIMGAVFGFVFGALDIQDADTRLSNKFLIDEEICLPVAFVLGAIAGAINQRQSSGQEYMAVPSGAYDDGI